MSVMSDTVRILKVTHVYWPYVEKGGPVTCVKDLAERLVRRGHQVTVLTVDWGKGWRGRLPEAGPRTPVEAIYLDFWLRYRMLTVNPGLIPFCRRRLRGFDVVHVYGLYDLLGPVVTWFCRRWGIPYVVEPLGMFRPIVRNVFLKRLYLRLLGEPMVKGAKWLIATSEQERRELIEGGMPESKVYLRRNGIEVPEHLPRPGIFRQGWGIPADARVVLFLGRLVRKKSPDLLIEAFAEWAGMGGPMGGPESGSLGPPVLVMAGPEAEGGYRARLTQVARGLGLTVADQPIGLGFTDPPAGGKGWVLFPGLLWGTDKWAAYRDADVFVLPSQNENFGNSVAEAVLCGTPVIVTDRCGIAPLVEGRAGLVVPYGKAALVKALCRFFSDVALRERLQAGCWEMAQSFSWDEPVTQMEVLYQSLVQKT